MAIARKALYCFLLALPATLWVACQSAQTQFSASTILMPEKGGDFRGVHIGDSPGSIKRSEIATSVYSMPDELIYRFQSVELESSWYEISYNFNDDGLHHIHLDVYPSNARVKKRLIDDFIAYYDTRLGLGEHQATNCEWRTLTDHGRLVNIMLSEGAGKESRTCIKLIFNESNP